jgi:hypothetical protein
MSTEKSRWAKLAGLPEPTDKQQLDENFVGMGMVGNIFDREKEQYEDAFEHFLSERYEEKVEENYATEVRDAWPSLSIDDRVSLLLTVFDDPDMAEEMAEKDFNELPEAAKANMRMDMLEEGELNEGELDFEGKVIGRQTYDVLDEYLPKLTSNQRFKLWQTMLSFVKKEKDKY